MQNRLWLWCNSIGYQYMTGGGSLREYIGTTLVRVIDGNDIGNRMTYHRYQTTCSSMEIVIPKLSVD